MVAAATRYRWLRHAATQLERAHRALPRRQRRRSPTNPPPEPNRREPEECGSRQRVECISERTALGPMLAQHERALGAVPSVLRLDAGYLGIGLLTRPSARSRCCAPAAGPITRTGNGASAVNRSTSASSFTRRSTSATAARRGASCTSTNMRRIGADAGACAIAARTAAMASCVRSAPSHLREKTCVVTPVKRSSRRGRSIAPAGCAARISAPRGSAPAGVRAPARTPAIGSLPAPWTRCGTRRVRAALHRLKAAGGGPPHSIPHPAVHLPRLSRSATAAARGPLAHLPLPRHQMSTLFIDRSKVRERKLPLPRVLRMPRSPAATVFCLCRFALDSRTIRTVRAQ